MSVGKILVEAKSSHNSSQSKIKQRKRVVKPLRAIRRLATGNEKRMKRFELSTLSLARRCSTTELHPHVDAWVLRLTTSESCITECPWVKRQSSHGSGGSHRTGIKAAETGLDERRYQPSQTTMTGVDLM